MHPSKELSRAPKTPTAAPHAPRRRKKSPRRDLILWGIGVALAIAVVAVLATTGRINFREISDSIARLNPILVIALMALLPLAGFSISIVYLIVGARFGPYWGLPVVIGITAFHLLMTYWLTRSFFRGPLERFLERRGYHLPHVLPGEETGVCLLGVLVPGLPYFARNYLLALTEVRLKIYFWTCLIVYVLRSYVAILLGDLTSSPSVNQIATLALVYAVKLSICAYIVWRLRRHRHPHETKEALVE